MNRNQTAILGISGYYHDSAACLVIDGRIAAAAQEERFSRKKFDARFPRLAIQYCLETCGLSVGDVSEVVFYDKPLLKFDRLLETYMAYAPKGLTSFATAMPLWLKEKLYLKSLLRSELAPGQMPKGRWPPLVCGHHQAHGIRVLQPLGRGVSLCGVGDGRPRR